MTADTERLFVQLEARVADFEKRMRQAERRGTRTYSQLQRGSRTATRRMERDMTRASTRMNTALASTATAAQTVRRSLMTIGAPIAGVAGFGMLTRGVRNAVGEMADLSKAARDVSMDVEDLQGVMRGFERETRISGDQSVQALERFNRRVGQAAEGTGELSNIVERYGIRLRNANGELREQGEILREVADAISRAGSDQERAAIAQAAFGDVGRQMAAALAEGAGAIDRMVREARTAGDVIDRDLVQRAEELDDRFADVARTISVGFTRASNEAMQALNPLLDAIERAADRRSGLADIFGSQDAARGALGAALFDTLADNRDAIQEHLRTLQDLAQGHEGLERQGREAADAMQALTEELIGMGEINAARTIGSIGEDVRAAVTEFREGETTAAEFGRRMGELANEIDFATDGIADLDSSTLDAIKAQFGGLIGLVELLSARVAEVKAEAAGVGTALTPAQRRAGLNDDMTAAQTSRRQAEAALRDFLAEEERLAARTREQIELERELEQVQRRAREEGVELTEAQAEAQARANVQMREATGGSTSGGGGSAGGDDFMRAVELIQRRTRLLEAEGAALVMAAQSGRQYGDAIEFARQRAVLLVAAQEQGLAITPELEAAIDRLAGSYVEAGRAADETARAMREAEATTERHARTLGNLFTQIIQGSGSARSALAGFFATAAGNLATSAFSGILPSGGSSILSALGFAGGGYTGDGGRLEPAGVVHKGEYVFSKRAVESIGKNRLETMHRAAQGFAGGGMVGGGATPMGGEATLRIVAPEGFNVEQEGRIQGIAVQVVRAGLGEYDRALPDRMRQVNNDPRGRR